MDDGDDNGNDDVVCFDIDFDVVVDDDDHDHNGCDHHFHDMVVGFDVAVVASEGFVVLLDAPVLFRRLTNGR